MYFVSSLIVNRESRWIYLLQSKIKNNLLLFYAARSFFDGSKVDLVIHLVRKYMDTGMKNALIF